MIFKVAWFMVGKLSSPVLDGGHVAPCMIPGYGAPGLRV